MSWVRQGTISTTNGSTAVTGVDSLWSIGISPGASLYLVDGNGNPTEGPFEIAAINSNTSLTLAKPFPGTTGSARAYAISNTVGDQTVSKLANDMTQFYGEISELLDQPTTTPVANSIPVADGTGKIATGWVPDATTTTKGAVELATTTEAQAGTDATRAVTPATSGSRTTFAVTSTDNATSATFAPLKSAGGLAVAKDVWIGGDLITGGCVQGSIITTIQGNSNKTITVSFPESTSLMGEISLSCKTGSYCTMKDYIVYGGIDNVESNFRYKTRETEDYASIIVSPPTRISNTEFTITITNNTTGTVFVMGYYKHTSYGVPVITIV